MKKTLLMILLLLMFVITAAHADTAAFNFRNGITWGMTSADISGIEGRECDIEYSFDNEHFIQFYENTSVSKYAADMQFVFWDDLLRLAAYDFHGTADDGSFTYLVNAMDSTYGASAEADAAKICDVLNHVVPDLYLPNELTECRVWELADTSIYMFCYPENSFAIVYTDGAYFESITGFNVDGL